MTDEEVQNLRRQFQASIAKTGNSWRMPIFTEESRPGMTLHRRHSLEGGYLDLPEVMTARQMSDWVKKLHGDGRPELIRLLVASYSPWMTRQTPLLILKGFETLATRVYHASKATVRIKMPDGSWQDLGTVSDVKYEPLPTDGIIWTGGKRAVCECGGRTSGYGDYKPGHSHWCPVHQDKAP